LIKIGVARPDIYFEEAFSDTNKGWAIYNGELRHSSNATGSKYGTPIKQNDVIGVYLDMVEVQIFFVQTLKIFRIKLQLRCLRHNSFL